MLRKESMYPSSLTVTRMAQPVAPTQSAFNNFTAQRPPMTTFTGLSDVTGTNLLTPGVMAPTATSMSGSMNTLSQPFNSTNSLYGSSSVTSAMPRRASTTSGTSMISKPTNFKPQGTGGIHSPESAVKAMKKLKIK